MEKKTIIAIYIIILLFLLFALYNVHECFYSGKIVTFTHIKYWQIAFWTWCLGSLMLFQWLAFISIVLRQIRWIILCSIGYTLLYYAYRVYVCFAGEIILRSLTISIINVAILLVFIILMRHEHSSRNKGD
jgi:hypothetical protein